MERRSSRWARAAGSNGYFVTPARGAGYSLYVTEDGHAVAGLLYGPGGMELTGAQLAAARAGDAGAGPAFTAAREKAAASAAVIAHAETGSAGRPSSSASLARLFERSAAAFGFTLGERGPLVLLLGDPTCSFSRSAAARLGRAALDGRLQLRVVPVAVLGADAARRAVAIAAHRDPARAWFEGGGAADRTLGPETLGPESLGRRPSGRRPVRNASHATTLSSMNGARARCRSSPGARETLGPETARSDTGSATSTTSAFGFRRETLGPDTLRVGDGP